MAIAAATPKKTLPFLGITNFRFAMATSMTKGVTYFKVGSQDYQMSYNALMHIKKALITAAGLGTRFLPITKTIEKEMLPVYNKPVIDYLVDDCIRGGITEFVIVVNSMSNQIKEYYSQKPQIETELTRLGKHAAVETIQKLHQKANFTFLVQHPKDGYGTAVPLKTAQQYFANEDAFLVLMGDDFLYNGETFSEARQMIEHFKKAHLNSAAAGLVTCLQRPEKDLHKYGIAKMYEKDHMQYLEALIEKPSPGTAPSNLANISKYIFTPTVFEHLLSQTPNPVTNELYITDTATALAAHAPVTIYTPHSEYLDCGTPQSWLHANTIVAQHLSKD